MNNGTSSFINAEAEGYQNFVTLFSSPITDLTNYATVYIVNY